LSSYISISYQLSVFSCQKDSRRLSETISSEPSVLL